MEWVLVPCTACCGKGFLEVEQSLDADPLESLEERPRWEQREDGPAKKEKKQKKDIQTRKREEATSTKTTMTKTERERELRPRRILAPSLISNLDLDCEMETDREGKMSSPLIQAGPPETKQKHSQKQKSYRNLEIEQELLESFEIFKSLDLEKKLQLQEKPKDKETDTKQSSRHPLPPLPPAVAMSAPKSAKLLGRRKSQKPKRPAPSIPSGGSLEPGSDALVPLTVFPVPVPGPARDSQTTEATGLQRNFKRSKSTVSLKVLKEDEKQEHDLFLEELIEAIKMRKERMREREIIFQRESREEALSYSHFRSGGGRR
jgi:hypothetical protein